MLRFRISNMGCGGCAKRVAAVLRDVDPHAQATFDLTARDVSVTTEMNDPDRFATALRASGWKSDLLSA